MTCAKRIALFALLLASLCTDLSVRPCAAQAGAGAASPTQSTTKPNAPEGVTTASQEAANEKAMLKKEESQKALGVVPMFAVTSRHNAPPLTSGEKFHLMAKTFLDPFVYVVVGAQAGLGQAANTFDDYGQGAAGYFKRYGAAFTDSADSNFFSNFFYPVIFKQDPRYFRLGEGTKKERIWYSIRQEFVARQDSGRHSFHFSNVLGAFTAGTISNAYYPKDDRGVGLTASRAGIALGYGCLGNVALEFWPDVDRRLFHKKRSQTQPDEPPGTSPK